MDNSYKTHIKKTFHLAYPVSLSQLGHILAGFFDSVMVGQLGVLPLAASSLAHSIFILFMVAGLGVSNSITPLVARGHGSNNIAKISRVMSNALVINLLTGGFLFAAMYICGPLMNHMGQSEAVVKHALPYYNIMAFSMIPLMFFQSYRQFTEGLSKTKPAMMIMITGSIINVFLNYLLIFGKWGFPQMGLIGAGWATLISRIVMAIMIYYHVHSHRFYRQFTEQFDFIKLSGKTIRNILSIGLPISLQMLLEVGAFSLIAVMMGWISKSALAAHQIALSYSSLSFMVILGISTAATIRTSKIIGQKNFIKLKRVGYSSILLSMICTVTSATIFIGGSSFLPTLFTDRIEVIDIAAKLLIIAGMFQIIDGIQVVVLGILRGMTDVKIPSLIATFAYWIIGLPIGYILAFKYDYGPTGVWMSLLIGFIVAAVASFLRFKFMLRKCYSDYQK